MVTDVMVTVTDTNGNSVAGQGVTAIASDGSQVAWPTTDAQGQADVFVPAGAYTFTAVVNGNTYDSAADGDCVVPGCRAVLISVPTLVANFAVDDLGSLGGGATFANGVNNQDIVVGQSTTAAGTTHAFTWNGTDPLVDTGSAPGFPANSMATAISDTGIMTGSLPQPDESSHVFTYSTGGGFADLGVGGDDSVANDVFPVQGAYGYGVNNSGQVAGIMTSGGAIQGFRYTPGAGFLPIGTLGGPWSWANAIAGSGMVVGSSQLPGSPTTGYARLGHAVSYTDETGLVDLNSYVDPAAGLTLISANAAAGAFIAGGAQSTGPIVPFRLNTSTRFAEQLFCSWSGDTFAFAVNQAGDTVGFGYTDAADSEQAAFIYTDQVGFQNLNDLIDPTSGWTLESATGIDDSDDVVGWGHHNGQLSAFHLRISPQTIACQASGSQLCLWSDGVVDQGNGTYVALFGYSNSSSSSIDPNTNLVLIDGSVIPNPNPAPPFLLSPGSHPGAFLPSFGPGQTVTWTVNGQSITATADSRVLPTTAVVVPSVVGIASDGTTTKVVFDYAATTSTSIPYGEGQNGLSDQDGFIAAPPQTPPMNFVPNTHAPFVATLTGSQLTWTVQGRSVTATASSNQLTVATLSDGTHDATLPDGRKVNLDSVAPADPIATADPRVDEQYFGTLTGTLGVSPSGAASYTVPISIPPGVAGMAPSLSLTYSSQGKDGMAGQGWDLTGTSMIHLCPKTRIQDGIAQPIKMTDNDGTITDGVCLDGQRLLETATPGTYKLESEDFSTITRTVTGVKDTMFTVVTKAGQRRYYGLHPTTRVVLANGPFSDSNATSVWLLDTVVDQWGNYYQLHYDYDDTTRFPLEGAYVTSINYTGHLTSVDGSPADPALPGFQGPTIAPPNVITFSYENRPDRRLLRFHYATLQIAKRLTGITTPQGTYTLTYLPNDPLLPSRLQTISYCNGPTSLSNSPSSACLDSLQFGWDPGNYGWQKVPDPSVSGQANSYALPAPINGSQTLLNGVRLADLDGDGRVDEIVSRDQSSSYNAASHVWWNNGNGWSCKDGGSSCDEDWRLPASLADSSGKIGAFLVDVDGDGLPDLVSKNAQGKPVIWYNRLKVHGGWVLDQGQLTAGFPSNWGSLAFHVNDSTKSPIDSILDINGDGKADIVRQWPINGEIDALLNSASGWTAADYSIGDAFATQNADGYTFSDINRDGVADLINGAGVISASPTFINIGTGDLNAAKWSVQSSNVTLPSYDPTKQLVADLDGDGYRDVVEDDVNIPATAVYGTGTDYTQYSIYPFPGSFGSFGGYAGGLSQYDSTPAFGRTADFISIADLNGDGLADAIVSQNEFFTQSSQPFGQVLINQGAGNGWIDPSGAQGPSGQNAYSVPFAADPANIGGGSAYIDLNGDGLVDIVHAFDDREGTAVTEAWLNTFHPPIIKQFPAGLAGPTTVCYKTITTADAQKPGGVYDDSAPLATNTTYMAAPLRVVESTTADAGLRSDGTGSTVKTTYQYEALRGSAFGRGPQGFQSVTVTAPDGKVTTTTYAQAYPYTGLPITVVRSYDIGDGGPKKEYGLTTTVYCAYQLSADTTNGNDPTCLQPDGPEVPPGTSLFLYPAVIRDATGLESGTAADRNGQNASITVTTSNLYDHHGNPTTVTVQTEMSTPVPNSGPTVETWNTTTVNEYGDEGSDIQLQGKVTKATVTTQQLAPVTQQARAHVTGYGYAPISSYFVNDSTEHFLYGMSAKTAEPGAGYPIELDISYLYDDFGNVKSTKTCDNGTGGCRTTTASYDPGDFVAPQGTGLVTSLGYQAGLFPVRKTNAAGQSEYFVYDAVRGGLLQHTGPNGITTCNTYDSFGNESAETARCGSSSPLTTSTTRFRSIGDAQPAQVAAATVTVVRPPAGTTNWTYTDTLGRTVETLTRNLNGGLTETDTTYDALGRVFTRTPATLVGDLKEQTKYDYDGLSRITEIHEAIGDIDGSGQSTFALIVTSYQGSSVTTMENVHGQTQQRIETKNAIGKIASVTDANGQVTFFQYDSDGNLTDAGDPANGTIPTVHTEYDSRNRKAKSVDPDMGTWRYCYDGFGEVVGQFDGKTTTSGTCTAGTPTIAMTYDSLGRMTSRTDSSGTAQWIYDSASGAGIGKLAASVGAPDANLGICAIPNGATVRDGNRAIHQYAYTQFGDVQEVDECADGSTFATTYQYDALGRQSQIRYPAVSGSQLAVGYHYTNLGFLQYLTDDSTDYSVLWQAKGAAALGQVTDEQMGNGVETVATRNLATGWLMSSSSTAHFDGNALIQSWANTYDEVGNLRTRTRSDAVNDAPSVEIFGYDLLNRLKSSEVQLPTLSPNPYDQTDNYYYDALGNLTTKSDRGYTYGTGCNGAAGPHAVCTVSGGAPYAYDANGNMFSGGGRTITYNPSNKPTEIVSEAPSETGVVDFAYDADGDRVLQVASGGGSTSRTVYVGLGGTGKSLYERTTIGGVSQHTFFMYAGAAHGGNAFALRVLDDSGHVQSNSFFNFDHLGSTTAISDEKGHVTSVASAGPAAGVLGYDPWGARRNPDGQAADPSTFDLAPGHREFTGQETISSIGLVNMNGRVYDPVLGRFLSPDPNVQSANDLQSYNRYSYVLNNPLRYTDPTGYLSWGSFEAALPGVFIALAGAGACAVTGGVGCAVAGIVSAVLSAGVARVEGASWSQVATNFLIGAISGNIGGAAGSAAGTALGAGAGSAAEFAATEVGGALGGAIGGALSTWAGGSGGLGTNVLLGAAEGAAWAAVGWGAAESHRLTKGDDIDMGAGGSGEAQAESQARSDAVAGGDPHDPIELGKNGNPILVDGPRTPEQNEEDVEAREWTDSDAPKSKSGQTVSDATTANGIEYGATKRKGIPLGEGDTMTSHSGKYVRLRNYGDQNEFAVHTHPGSSGTDFSNMDLGAARTLNAPLYMEAPNKTLWVLDPIANTIMFVSSPARVAPGTVSIPSVPIK